MFKQEEIEIVDGTLQYKKNGKWISFTQKELTEELVNNTCKYNTCKPRCDIQCPKVKILRHMETVKNYLDAICKELLKRGEYHDQSKLGLHENDFINPKYDLRNMKYGDAEYEEHLKILDSSLKHHYSANRHHPEHFKNGIMDMHLIDIIEMFVDWYSSVKRHNEGDINKSIEYNKERFQISEDLISIFKHTASFLGSLEVYHNADES